MPADANECRRHALHLARLAQTSTTPEAREHYAELAKTWLKIAADLESGQALLDAMDEIEPIETDRIVCREKAPRRGTRGF
jgi:hypothetical protein